MKRLNQLSLGGPETLSHMPFIARQNEKLTIIYCRSDKIAHRVPQYSRSGTGRVWKLHWVEMDEKSGVTTAPVQVATGLALNEVECSPCLVTEQGQLHLSFIGTSHHGTGPLEHHLYSMAGPSMSALSPPVRVLQEPCFTGFHRPGLTASASGQDGKFQLIGVWPEAFETSFAQIVRISCCNDCPHHLIITGFMPEDMELDRTHRIGRTILFDLKSRTVVGEIQLGGQPVYKASLFENSLAYVDRTPDLFQQPDFLKEKNQICFSESPSLVSANIEVC